MNPGDRSDVANALPGPNASTSKPKRPRRSPYRTPPGRPAQHGGAMLTRVLRTVPLDRIDGRSQVGAAIRRARQELVTQLGGDVTPAQSILIDEIARKAVICRAVGEWILVQQSLVLEGPLGEKGDAKILDAVMQHDKLTATLAGMLERLGLERRARTVDLAEQLAALHSKPGADSSS